MSVYLKQQSYITIISFNIVALHGILTNKS